MRRSLRLACSITAVAMLSALALAGTAPAPAVAQTPGTFDPALLDALQWRNIGPQRGGRSIAVAGSSKRKNEYYFGATGGGLWKTTDGGTTWNPVSDAAFRSSSVGAVAVCEADPDVVYAGMGEVQLRGNILQGDGVYRSSDGGRSWRHIGLKDTQTISRLRVDPTNCDRVFAAALGHPYGPNPERGVFRSTDGGGEWERVLYRGQRAGAADLVVDPANPDVLYATFWEVYRRPWQLWSGGPGSGLFKSTDGGDTWTELTGNPGFPRGPLGKIGVSVSGADSQRVYAIVEAEEGGVLRSDDGGATWAAGSTDRQLRQRAFYYTRIYADPQERDAVYVLNVNFWRSTNAGASFSSIPTLHVDNHDLWIDPEDPQRMIEGNDGGASVSVNGGRTWTEQDYSTAQMYHVIATNDTPYRVCGAQQDNSTVCTPNNATGRPGEFFPVGGGESGYIAQDQEENDVFYAGSYGGYLTRLDRRTGQARNINPWPDNPMGSPAGVLRERFQWTFPIITDPLEPDAVYASSQHLFKTTNEGQSWDRISPDLTRADPSTLGNSGGLITLDQTSVEYYATIFTVAPSRVERGTIWTGSDDGLVHLTRDGGGSWTEVTPSGLPPFMRISLIEASPHDPGTAYLAGNRYQLDDRAPYLYRTRDYGRTWTRITDGIASGDFLRAVREDPVRPGLLFAGTEHGVYVSFDDGGAWHSLRRNLPDVSVQDLVVKENDLVLGTHGRGFYVMDDIGLLRQLTPASAERTAHLYQPATQALAGDGKVSFDYWLAKTSGRARLTVRTADGRAVRRRVSRRAGAHRVAWRLGSGAAGTRVELTVGRRTLRRTLRGGTQRSSSRQARKVRSGADARARARTTQRGDRLIDPSDPIRSVDTSVAFVYQLAAPAEQARIEVLDAGGTVIRTLATVPRAPGVHRVTWDLRVTGPVSFPGLIYWAANPTRGPRAPWGDYTVRLVVDGEAQSQEFSIRKDPRLTEISQADVEEQYRFGLQIRDRTSDANRGVIRIRACRSQIDERLTRTDDADVVRIASGVRGDLTSVEEAIYQTRLQSSQDPLNFPIRLNNRIAALLGVIESSDHRPTDQSYAVFNLLSRELETQLGRLADVAGRDVAELNELLALRGLAPVECGEAAAGGS